PPTTELYTLSLHDALPISRLRPAEGLLEPKVEMNDRELVQLICAYRIFNEEVELSLSTRESEKFRNNIIQLGITSISAGSKTNRSEEHTSELQSRENLVCR